MSSKSTAQVFISRLASTLVLWGTFTAVFIIDNPWAFVAPIIILGVASANEFFKMAKTANYPAQTWFGIGFSTLYLITICGLLAYYKDPAHPLLSQIDAASIAAITLFSFIYQLKFEVKGSEPLTKVASTVLGFLYVAFLFSFMARVLFIPNQALADVAVPGAYLMLWLCVVTKFTDMGAYLTGTICGKVLKLKTHKMIPHISPGKTWEGFFGAIVIALGSAVLLYALLPDQLAMLASWGHVLALGVILPLFAVVGDLAESVIKRSLAIKDSGSFLPGIGGALDLIDSLCFTAPVLYFYIIWFT